MKIWYSGNLSLEVFHAYCLARGRTVFPSFHGAVDAALVGAEPAGAAALASRSATDDTVFRSTAYDGLARTMADARVPDCLHADALKHQFKPMSGIYAAPFVLIAKLRGKCN